jgi:hypothetical protein
MAKNYLPGPDADFNRWFKNLSQYIAVKCKGTTPEWTHIPKAEIDKLDDHYTAWYSAYAITLKPHTQPETAEKTRVRKAAEKYVREFVNRFLRYEPVANLDRDNMEVPNRDAVLTPIPDPVSQITCDVTFPGYHMVELKRMRPMNGPPPDPRSDYGAKVFYGLTGKPSSTHPNRLKGPPLTGLDLPESAFTRKKKMLFDFDGESGNTVYFCLRYESPTGGEGPFGAIFSVVIN